MFVALAQLAGALPSEQRLRLLDSMRDAYRRRGLGAPKTPSRNPPVGDRTHIGSNQRYCHGYDTHAASTEKVIRCRRRLTVEEATDRADQKYVAGNDEPI